MANKYGWQWGFWAPGAIGLSLALFSLAVVRDSPQEAGFIPERELMDPMKRAPEQRKDNNSIRAALMHVRGLLAYWGVRRAGLTLARRVSRGWV